MAGATHISVLAGASANPRAVLLGHWVSLCNASSEEEVLLPEAHPWFIALLVSHSELSGGFAMPALMVRMKSCCITSYLYLVSTMASMSGHLQVDKRFCNTVADQVVWQYLC